MRKILSAILAAILMLSPLSAFAAIAIDATSQFTDSQASPATETHTVTGSNTMLFCITRLATSATIRSVTYNGVSMTSVLSALNPTGDGRLNEIWYLVNPASGSHTVSVTYNGGGTVFRGACASYTGVAQTAPEASAQDTQVATSLAVSVTASANAWLVGLGIQYSGNNVAAGTFERVAFGGLATSDGYNLLDSNGARSAGTQSLGINDSPIGSMGLTVVSIAPFVAASAVIASQPAYSYWW